MFDHQCTSCGKHQLIFPSQVTSVANSEAGIVVRFTCWCGSAQTWVTGRRRTPLAAATAA